MRRLKRAKKDQPRTARTGKQEKKIRPGGLSPHGPRGLRLFRQAGLPSRRLLDIYADAVEMAVFMRILFQKYGKKRIIIP
ncbi:MAG: hypothetical protein LBT33_10240 [Spirochaetia bacterium]|jgi:hypothetical protein|nr:hypothetical protein [Spirochaetia bacterium]